MLFRGNTLSRVAKSWIKSVFVKIPILPTAYIHFAYRNCHFWPGAVCWLNLVCATAANVFRLPFVLVYPAHLFCDLDLSNPQLARSRVIHCISAQHVYSCGAILVLDDPCACQWTAHTNSERNLNVYHFESEDWEKSSETERLWIYPQKWSVQLF